MIKYVEIFFKALLDIISDVNFWTLLANFILLKKHEITKTQKKIFVIIVLFYFVGIYLIKINEIKDNEVSQNAQINNYQLIEYKSSDGLLFFCYPEYLTFRSINDQIYMYDDNAKIYCTYERRTDELSFEQVVLEYEHFIDKEKHIIVESDSKWVETGITKDKRLIYLCIAKVDKATFMLMVECDITSDINIEINEAYKRFCYTCEVIYYSSNVMNDNKKIISYDKYETKQEIPWEIIVD